MLFYLLLSIAFYEISCYNDVENQHLNLKRKKGIDFSCGTTRLDSFFVNHSNIFLKGKGGFYHGNRSAYRRWLQIFQEQKVDGGINPIRQHTRNRSIRAISKQHSAWRDTLNGVSRQFYSPASSDIATQ